jgi:elongation factor 1-beta
MSRLVSHFDSYSPFISQFDVSTDKGLASFNGFMASRSYVEGWSFSNADKELFGKFSTTPDATKYPHAYRWYVHIAALTGTRSITARRTASPVATAATAAKKNEDDDDDFDVFGDDDDDGDEDEGGEPKESRAEMLARLKKEAEERYAKKEKKQRTLVSIEIKPWDVEQDLMALWKKITTTITQDGLKWGEKCTLAPVAFGIKKIQCTFTMGVNNSSEDVVDDILKMEDEVQSVEITSMNVL